MKSFDYPRIIKEYRELHFLTQTDLAKILGVTYVTINRWENGHYKPTTKLRKKIHDLLEMRLDEGSNDE